MLKCNKNCASRRVTKGGHNILAESEDSGEDDPYDLAAAIAEDVGGGGRQVFIAVISHLELDVGQGEHLHGYLDESVSADGKFFCSAGYLFEPPMARRFREAWKPFLDSKGMEFFHATDDFRRPDAEEIFSSLAKLTKDTALRGCINFLSDKELTRLSKSGAQRYAGSGFSTSTLGCMKLMADMAREQNRRIVYFIEGGNRFAGELRHFLSQIKERPQQIDQYAMAGADTYDKKDVIQLQAADLFAWSFTRSHYRGSWAEAVFMLTKDRVLPHTMTSFDPVMLAMVNSFHGMRSNRKRFS